jgi:hypothetical protein
MSPGFSVDYRTSMLSTLALLATLSLAHPQLPPGYVLEIPLEEAPPPPPVEPPGFVVPAEDEGPVKVSSKEGLERDHRALRDEPERP